jgi:predicted O-linked N-acetylglucosamine transferase (SPINDLY family)
LARQGQLARAESICQEILREQSDHPDALLLRGVIELQTGRIAQAAASFRASIQKNAAQPVALALLGDALLDLHQPEEALLTYGAALRLSPELAPVHFGCGNALLDLQRPLQALASFDEVLRRQPNHPEALFNRGNALLGLGRHDAAVDSYDRAIALQPAYAAAYSNRGSAFKSLGRAHQALASFDAALTIDPRLADALNNRGCILRELGQPQAALDAFDRALQVRPDYAEAHHGRGNALRDLNRPLEALTSYDKALQLRNNFAAAHCGRGDALLALGRLPEALAAHDTAVLLEPDYADGYNSRGNSLRFLRRFPEAIACYDHALHLDPDNATALYNRGCALLEGGGRLEEALASYERAQQLKPNFTLALRMRGDALLALKRPDAAARCFAELLSLDPTFDYAAGALLHARQNCADWSVSVPLASRERIYDAVLAGKRADSPFSFLSVSDSSAAQLQCARTYVAYRCPPTTPLWTGQRYRHERIRVAYVSSDLRTHAVSYLLAGVFEQHDRQRFETTAISLRPEESSALGRRVKGAFNRFVDVSARSDREVAELLRNLEIDIAVDLVGFTEGLRPGIFAHRAAPIQVNYLGFPGTLGAPYVDYILADRFVIPPERQVNYSEHVVYLPDCFQANDDKRAISGQAVTRADAGLADASFVFCCFNNSYKINPAMFDIWMRLLDQVPGSVLWLVDSGETARANLQREAAHRGVDPRRLVFAARQPYAEHLSRLSLADLFLDTLPFNGGTTASDALWAGLPLLTCAGDAFAARMAGSVLRAAGLPELVTQSLVDYEAKALALARQPQDLHALRARLGETRRAPLFDTDRFRRHLESAYEQMWQRHERGEEPASFAVPPVSGHP